MTGPFVWHEDGRYYLYYIGVTEGGYEGGRKTINLATSTDLYRWERHAGNPVVAPAGDGWRRDAAWRPYVVADGGTYYLFFNASGVVDGHEEEYIGHATSTDLMQWTVDDANAPLLTGSRTPGASPQRRITSVTGRSRPPISPSPRSRTSRSPVARGRPNRGRNNARRVRAAHGAPSGQRALDLAD